MSLRKPIIDKMMRLDSIMRKIDGKDHSNDRRLSLLELRTLSFINERKNTKPMDLVNEFDVSPATITAQIDRLVSKNCLKREADNSDARSVNLRLTPKIEETLDKMLKIRLLTYDTIFKNLTKQEQETLLSLMKKMESGL